MSPKPDSIEPLIHLIRGERVLLDVDLAALYGVTTGALNQAVKRNVDRFPADFMFRLAHRELEALMSQAVISNRRIAIWRGGSKPWRSGTTSSSRPFSALSSN